MFPERTNVVFVKVVDEKISKSVSGSAARAKLRLPGRVRLRRQSLPFPREKPKEKFPSVRKAAQPKPSGAKTTK